MNNKQKIIDMYYIKHHKIKDIADLLLISSPYICKIIKQDQRYNQEKKYRKDLSKKKHQLSNKKYMKKKREIERQNNSYSVMMQQHNQAVSELSYSTSISNQKFREWNSSAYNYNFTKNQYEFNKNLGYSYNIPKVVKNKTV